MGLPKIIQIPCHHVLDNQNALKFKKGASLKQFFKINLGIGIIKKTTFFVCISDISPRVFTQISIRRARWMQNFPKNKKYLKILMMISSSHFSGISCFWGSGVHQKYVEWVFIGCRI